MAVAPQLRLLMTPETLTPVRRKALVARMATDLTRYDALNSETDAIRSLFGRGYSMPDIVLLVADARALGMQQIVAQEMARP